jgi:hypothetical protein
LYRDDMKLGGDDDEACIKYIVRKMLAWYTNFSPKNEGAAEAVEASTPPPRTPDSPAVVADGPRPKHGMALSYDESEVAKPLK